MLTPSATAILYRVNAWPFVPKALSKPQYYRTGKCLWYVTIVHAFNDFCAFLGTGFLAGGSTGASISQMAIPLDDIMKAIPVMAVLYLLPALIVLRPNKVKPLLERQVI